MLTINVCSGIGDISWVLQKLFRWKTTNSDAPELNVRIAHEKPQRSLPFLELMDWIETSEYHASLNTFSVLQLGDSLKFERKKITEDNTQIYLQANHHLEAGNHISKYLPEMENDYHYKISFTKRSYFEKLEQKMNGVNDAIGIYSSSLTSVKYWGQYGAWSNIQWIEFCIEVNKKFPESTLMLIGADFDSDMLNFIAKELSQKSIPHVNCAGVKLGTTFLIMQRCKYFFSYPSGLGIVANVLNVPCTMFMPNHYIKMLGTWGDPKDIESGKYKVLLFPPSPTKFFETWKNEIWEKIK